ncbi:hypothetical protein BDS110ZK4_83580 [Bradyrhizobium diazoefficiens]|jgi:hypothetical protein
MKRRRSRWSQALRSNLVLVGHGSQRQSCRCRRFCDEISHFTRKDVKNLVWLALTDLEEDAMEFSVDARA